jgi:hypothetical protein
MEGGVPLAFVAVTGRRSVVWIGTDAVGSYDAVHDLVLGAGGRRHLLVAERDGEPLLVVDGVELHHRAVAGTLVFTDGGDRWGAMMRDPERDALLFLLDGARGPSLELVTLRDFISSQDIADDEALSKALRGWVRIELVGPPVPARIDR